MALARLLAAALASLMLGLAGPAAAQATSAQHAGENGAAGKALRAMITYGGDLIWPLTGGVRSGPMYEARLGLILDSDLETAFGWRGASAHLSVHALHGSGIEGDRVQNLMTVSGLEAEPNLRLFNLWVEQRLGAKAALRVGQFTAGQEFMVSPTANLFVNSTFGWPTSFSADLPSGGPSFPIAAPGLRLGYQPTASTTLLAAIFPGDPAGRGSGDPQRRDAAGFNSFRLAGRPFVIVEAAWQSGAATLKLGGWLHFEDFADVRPDHAASHPGDAALYAIADGPLWTSADGHRVLHGFVRGSLSPSDRNRVDRYLDAGVGLSAPFAARPADTLGLAVAYARLQPDASLPGAPGVGYEAVIEASYQAQLTSSLALQPDVQLVLHPNGGVAADGAPRKNAVVAGVRTQWRF